MQAEDENASRPALVTRRYQLNGDRFVFSVIDPNGLTSRFVQFQKIPILPFALLNHVPRKDFVLPGNDAGDCKLS